MRSRQHCAVEQVSADIVLLRWVVAGSWIVGDMACQVVDIDLADTGSQGRQVG